MFRASLLLGLFALAATAQATFLSVHLFNDPECSMDFVPAGVGATDSYLRWTTLPTSSVVSDWSDPESLGVCVNNPITGVRSGKYVCQSLVNPANNNEFLTRVTVTEFNSANCSPDPFATGNFTNVINSWLIVGNGTNSDRGAVCLDAYYANNQLIGEDWGEYVPLFTKIVCSLGTAPAGSSSSTASMPPLPRSSSSGTGVNRRSSSSSSTAGSAPASRSSSSSTSTINNSDAGSSSSSSSSSGDMLPPSVLGSSGRFNDANGAAASQASFSMVALLVAVAALAQLR